MFNCAILLGTEKGGGGVCLFLTPLVVTPTPTFEHNARYFEFFVENVDGLPYALVLDTAPALGEAGTELEGGNL